MKVYVIKKLFVKNKLKKKVSQKVVIGHSKKAYRIFFIALDKKPLNTEDAQRAILWRKKRFRFLTESG